MHQPTDEQLLQWKTDYGSIYTFQLEEYLCVYRALNTLEHLAATQLQESLPDRDWNYTILYMALLYPSPDDLDLPGSIIQLTDQVMNATVPLVEDLDDRIATAREKAESLIGQSFPLSIALAISQYYPGLDVFALAKLPVDQLLTYAAMVERITQESFLDKFLQYNKQASKRNVDMSRAENRTEQMDITPELINETSESLQDMIQKEREMHKHG